MMNKKIFNYKAFLKVIEENTGYDFSGYSLESLNRKLENFISSESIGSVEELHDLVYSNKISQEKILDSLLVNYTEMFRDPEFFVSLKANVLPYFSTLQKINIWHAGCATGEEVYSLAILLDEFDLLDRCEIHATDINVVNLKNAIRGIFPLSHMRESASRYYRSGGTKNLSNYYTVFYDNVIFHKHLRERLRFVIHDLSTEDSEDKFHLILCRNVFIYFNYSLQRNVLVKLISNIHNDGFLGMGLCEHFVDVSNPNLSMIDLDNKLFRKTIKV